MLCSGVKLDSLPFQTTNITDYNIQKATNTTTAEMKVETMIVLQSEGVFEILSLSGEAVVATTGFACHAIIARTTRLGEICR